MQGCGGESTEVRCCVVTAAVSLISALMLGDTTRASETALALAVKFSGSEGDTRCRRVCMAEDTDCQLLLT